MPRRTHPKRRSGSYTVSRNPAFKQQRGPVSPFAVRMRQQLDDMQRQAQPEPAKEDDNG